VAGERTGARAAVDVSTPVRVAGLVPLSTVDWPGHLAAVVFLQGCPWRCTYCHNRSLLDPRAPGALGWSEVQRLLDRRRGMLDGVVFSGGEPTLQPGLSQAVDDVRERGFAVGLHTGGAWPRRLAALLPRLDWVGLDIKHLPDRYDAVTRARPSGLAAWTSLRAVLESGVDHEVRTTVDPTVHTHDDVARLASRLRAMGVRRHVLQEARPDGADAEWARALAGRRLADVVPDGELPGVARRVA
jgi:pyruvate formate lyase activating enzyme